MQFLIEKIATLRFGWNERPLGEADLYRLCRRFKITIEEMPLRTNGFYYRVMGRDFIAIDSKLSGPEKLFVMFHELGHFLLHVPDSGMTANFHGVGRRTRKEREADAFALCALVPKPLVEGRTPQDLIDEGFPAAIVAQRFKLYKQRGI